ncbi:RNA-binding S4 domain-containing protein [Alphaproteobacteria bacterium]|nr:RNA-binding S4 domain-containing protein [Alphaproteobacteria bacterium]MDC0148350.1 RNA-binding S4 domain-containing protein [Alphaproteobacteria bacterium]MDC1241075.1 RNA-binding S4 domain-containing protein [bacterium]
MRQPPKPNSPTPNMRADKWLWHARFFKTRTLATHFVGNGHLRINGVKQSRASAALRVGDILVFHLNDHVRMIETLALSTRRGPAPEAQALYADRDPPKPKAAEDKMALREAGSGRPTKKQRRQLDAFFEPKNDK